MQCHHRPGERHSVRSPCQRRHLLIQQIPASRHRAGSGYADFVGDGPPTPASGKTLDQLKQEHIASTQRGYPILVAGAVYFLVLALLRALVPVRTVQLIWVLGLCVIFPAGVLLGRTLGIDVISRGNPLGTLGGLIAATQVFYLPVFIAVYQFQPSLLPLTIGLLGGAHFLPYGWLYNSRGYLFVAVATGLSALILGGPFMASSLTSVPLAIALTYALGTLWILRENRKQ